MTKVKEVALELEPPAEKPAELQSAAGHAMRDQSLLRSPFVLLPAIWFLCGTSSNLPGTASKVFRVSILRVEPEVQAILFGALLSLPWQFKLAFAFLSDS